jgi:hypothetical protein
MARERDRDSKGRGGDKAAALKKNFKKKRLMV